MSEPTAHVRKAYDEWAAAYDFDQNPTRDLNARLLRRQTFALEGKSVLEIGCGTGLNTVWLAERAARVEAIDISEEMLKRARGRVESQGEPGVEPGAKSRNVRFQVSDINRPWPFEGGSLDLIVANLVLEHIEDLGHIFSEGARVLGSGGLFYIGELHPYKQLQGTQARYRDADTDAEKLVPAVQHSISEFVNAGIGAGFALHSLGEWTAEGDEIDRLLTLLFERS